MKSAGTEPVRVEVRGDQIARLWIATGGGTQNVLDLASARGLADALERLSRDPAVGAVVLASDTSAAFMAGWDVELLASLRGREATEIARAAQRLTQQIADFPKPVVAAIRGACMGVGLELAVACTARIASEDRGTRFSQPEVRLGLLPCAGGTLRLPRLIGPAAAVELMLSGRVIDVREALSLGLVDDVVPADILLHVAELRAAELRRKSARFPRRVLRKMEQLFSPPQLAHMALSNSRLGREAFQQLVRAQLRDQPLRMQRVAERLLAVIRTGLAQGAEEALKAEQDAFGELASQPEAAHLTWLSAQQQAPTGEHAMGRPSETRALRRVGVVGAGTVGAGVSYLMAASAATPVRLRDRDNERVLAGLRRIRGLVDDQAASHQTAPHEGEVIMHRIAATTGRRGFAHCDLVIEAVPEVLELKQHVLQELASLTGSQTILASSSSSIPIHRIAQGARHPERFIGMHYFSPVERVPLLELVAGEATAAWVIASCAELGRRQGKTVIVVSDTPGFYTTRVLYALLFEATELLREGVDVAQVDDELQRFGFAVGPFKLMDEIGLDVVAHVAGVLVQNSASRLTDPFGVRALVAAQRKGRKSGSGFYSYTGQNAAADPSLYELLDVASQSAGAMGGQGRGQEIVQRCALRMLNEAVQCRAEGVVRSPRDGDVGAVLGLGFPAFLGGPFRFADSLGAHKLVRTLESLRERHGMHFEPAQVLYERIERGDGFYAERAPVPDGLRISMEAA